MKIILSIFIICCINDEVLFKGGNNRRVERN